MSSTAEEERSGSGAGPSQRIAGAIFDLLGKVPASDEPAAANPAKRSKSIASRTAVRAAFSAGSLALPPGPLGWLTILPELRTVWKQQAQMVADIAATFGKSQTLSREQMLYCLFRHIAPAAFKDVVTGAPGHYVVARASPQVLRAIVQKIGLRISLRVLGRGVSRWVPGVGAVGVGAYAYYETGQVAATARALFSSEIEFDAAPEHPPAQPG